MSSNTTAGLFLVEDDALVAGFLTECLAASGYRILGSTGFGEKAVELIPALSPDLVLMDIRLAGDLDGIGAALALRSRCNVPVIFLTGSHENETRNRACVAAPYGFVTKPVRRASLVASVEAALARRRSERNELAEVRRPACEDQLTGLPNRRHFLDRVAIWSGGAGRSFAAVCLCDLDRFRAINETLGRDVGDGLLRRFASLLRAGGSDLLCRVDGDRFCILFPGLGLAEAAARLDDIRLAFAEECQKKGVTATAAFGIGLMQAGDADVGAALHEADHRLNCSKQRGGNCVSAEDDTSTGDLLALYGLLGANQPLSNREALSEHAPSLASVNRASEV